MSLCCTCFALQGVSLESHPSKLAGSRGSKNRYFDFEKLAEVCIINNLNDINWLYSLKAFIFSVTLLSFFVDGQITALVTSNLNKIIDVNYYPVETAQNSNLRHRPIGIGVQGLADTFILLGMSFDSPEVIFFPLLICFNLGCIIFSYESFYYIFQAQQLNKEIFEAIYYHALKTSSEIAAKEGPYMSYSGSPVSKVYILFKFEELTIFSCVL